MQNSKSSSPFLFTVEEKQKEVKSLFMIYLWMNLFKLLEIIQRDFIHTQDKIISFLLFETDMCVTKCKGNWLCN
jgi:hypothetical protein